MAALLEGRKVVDPGGKLAVCVWWGGWLAECTIEKMSEPHRLDIFKHGHRVVCSGVLIGSFLDVLKVEAGFEGAQSWAAEQSSVSAMWSSLQQTDHRMLQRAQTTGWLSDIQCNSH